MRHSIRLLGLFVLIAYRALFAASPTFSPSPSPSPTETPACANAGQRYWDFSAGDDQWDFYMNMTASASAGVLNLSILASDPWMSGPDQLCLDPGTDRVLRFYYRNQAPGTSGSIYWRRYGEAYDEARRVDFVLQPDDGSFRLYEVDLGTDPLWSGLVRQVRLDPVSGASSGGGQLDWIGFATLTVSPTRSATRTRTPSATATVTPSATRSASPSATPTSTPSASPSRTASPTVSASPSTTPTPSPSASPSPSRTASPTVSASPSVTVSVSPSATPSPPPSATLSPSPSVTPSATRSPSTGFGAPSGRPGGFVSPNPFFPGRPPLDRARFQLEAGHAAGRLSILDLGFRELRRVDFGPAAEVAWDGKDDGGVEQASGTYLWLIEEAGAARRKGTVTLAR